MARQKLIHIHSFVNGKAPSATTVSFGEIAVNCNSSSPKLYIKTASSSTATDVTIESFSPDSVNDEKFVIIQGEAKNSAVLKDGSNDVTSEFEVALGTYNKSNSDTRFSIGIGTSSTQRKNAIEIKNNGDVYVDGIGGYDGTNPSESNDLATVIANVGGGQPDWNAQEGEMGYIQNKPVGILTEENLANCTNGYFAGENFGVPVVQHFRTPVVFYYTPDGVSPLLSEVRPIEVWRCNRLIAQFESSIFVKMMGFSAEPGPEAAYLPASLVLGNGGYWLIWEDDSKIYELLINGTNKQPEITLKSDRAIITLPRVALVYQRNSSKLIPGQQYRIIDYVTTTAQGNTRSAGHQFDIIVTADDVNKLNEEARACIHEGDTYFTEAGANLSAWKIWYCIDNDTERFAWADAENGKGVIYRMIDEWNNDCPYDFKNIIYTFNKSFMYTQWGNYSEFVRDSSIDKKINGTQYYGYVTDNVPPAWSQGKCWVTDVNVTVNSQLYNEDGSQISYGGTIYNVNNIISESYTFNEGALNDFSLEGEFCHENTILAWVGGLNKIIFKNDKTQSSYVCNYNSFSNDCYSNSFGNNCYSNSFGNDCYYNNFGNDCYYNNFDNDCNYNSFGNTSHSNSFGNNCESNSLGDDCNYNSFGNNCKYNSLGNNCSYNSFCNFCNSNSFGNTSHSNSFGNNCESNSFGDSCDSNSFGNTSHSNSFGDSCDYNSFGNDCNNNSFGNFCNSNRFGNSSSFNSFRVAPSEIATLKDYCSYNHFDDGCYYNVIWNSDTTSSSNKLQNINVNRGVSNSNYKFINIDTIKADYEIQVAKNSKGEIKIYCETDLIA